jgi:peptide/nickel transport system permease protein
MKRNYKLGAALVLLAAVHTFVLFAGFFAPYGFATQDREMPYAAPTRIHFVDADGQWHAQPFVYALKYETAADSTYREDSSHAWPIHWFVSGAPYKVAGLFSARVHLFGVDEPARIFLFGTDAYGRDQLSRFLYGGQLSLLAGILAVVFSVGIGTVIGLVAGFYGGWIDSVLMRGSDLFFALPWLYLLFAIRAALPLHVPEWQVFLLLVGVIGLIGWARPARLIRGVALSSRERNFVSAARGFGASDFYIMRRHVLPQTYGVVFTQAALLLPQYILAEVTLSFLGLGVGEPAPSWGSLLSSLQHYDVLSSYWWMFLPAVLLIPLFFAYQAAADALQERFESVTL